MHLKQNRKHMSQGYVLSLSKPFFRIALGYHA